MNNFTNFELSEQYLLMHFEFNKVIQLPFTEEFNESNIPNDLVRAASDFFANMPSGNELPPVNERAMKLINLIEKYYPNPNSFKSTKQLVKENRRANCKEVFLVEYQQKRKSTNNISVVEGPKGKLKDLFSDDTASSKVSEKGNKIITKTYYFSKN